MWIKNIHVSKLTLKMFLRILGAAAVSVAIYFLLTEAELAYLDHIRLSSDVYQDQLMENISDLQKYVTENNLSINDQEAIRSWDRHHSLIDIQLIFDDTIIYDSLDYMPSYSPRAGNIYNIIHLPFRNIIHFTDGDASIYTSPLYTQRLERRLDYMILIVSILFFCLMLILELHRLVRDIVVIDKGIRVLESGDLSYRITVHRDDEIEDLADSINRISKEILRQGQEEEQLRQKNYDMVTAVSHDIRTPLTSVIGYAELMQEDGLSEEKRKGYLEKIIDRSYLIKDMTDNLFQHFINNNQEMDYHFEVITGNDFVTYLINNLSDSLRDKNYSVELSLNLEQEFFMKADITQLRRVFNNLEGNLFKYADRQSPIALSAAIAKNKLYVTVKNKIGQNAHVESHGVGMRNCLEIIERHLGTMDSFVGSETFVIAMELPVYSLKELEECNE